MKTSLLSITALSLALLIPVTADAYGNRNWLNKNTHSNEDLSDNTYTWGYNYRSRGRHTTIDIEEDKAGWMHNGNVRGGTSSSTYLWKRQQKRFR